MERQIEEATGMRPEAIAFRSQLNLIVDRNKLLLYEVDYNEVVRTLRTAFKDNEVSVLRSYQQYLPITVAGDERTVSQVLAETLVENKPKNEDAKAYIPLKDLVSVRPAEDLKSITAGSNGEYIP